MVHRRRLVVIASAVALGAGLFGLGPGARAENDPGDSVSIDFENLEPGQILSTLRSGEGVSGPAVPGDVRVQANPTAITFNAECQGHKSTCTGGEADLFQPGQGLVAIPAKALLPKDANHNVANPESNETGGFIELDLNSFGHGGEANHKHLIDSITLLDTDEVSWDPLSQTYVCDAGTISLYEDGELRDTRPMDCSGNAGIITQDIGVGQIDLVRIQFRGSSALGSVNLTIHACEEDGLDATDGSGFGQLVSGTVDQGVEPVAAFVGLESVVDTVNCTLVVPVEEAVDGILGTDKP